MNKNNRLWIIGTVAIAIAIIVAGWLVGISPKLTEISESHAQRTRVDQNNVQQTAALAKLKVDFANLSAITEQLNKLKTQLPSQSNYPAFLGELNEVARKSSVDVTNASFGTPAAPPAAGSAPGAAAPTGSVPAGTVVAIPSSISFTGSFAHLQSAIRDLQSGDRLFLVSGFSLTADSGASASSPYVGTVTGLLYVITDGSIVITPPAAATPAPGTSAAPTPTSTP